MLMVKKKVKKAGKKIKSSVKKSKTFKKLLKKNKVSKKVNNKASKKMNKVKRKVIGNVAEKKSNKNRIERVPTYIPGFDRLIEGGFEKDSTNLLVGDSGSGKSIFSTQFLIGGIKKGEKCLYVTFEEKKDQFYMNMKKFGWDLESYEKKGLFNFLEYTPAKVKTMLEEGGGEIERIILGKKVTRLVIDSITSFALLFEDELSKREAALSLFGMLGGWDRTSLLTLEENPMKGTLSPKVLEFEADSILAVYFIRDEKERKRFIEVLKMRGTDHSTSVYSFDMGRSGIIIGKSPVKNPIKII